jgi:hypothetical protein
MIGPQFDCGHPLVNGSAQAGWPTATTPIATASPLALIVCIADAPITQSKGVSISRIHAMGEKQNS